jgi:hypothetical protein
MQRAVGGRAVRRGEFSSLNHPLPRVFCLPGSRAWRENRFSRDGRGCNRSWIPQYYVGSDIRRLTAQDLVPPSSQG